jgi:group I intron endonuclease
MSLVGIYKITSPSGKVYIGQSWDIHNRFKTYKCNPNKKQSKIYNSIHKHGWDAHTKEILIELKSDTTQSALDDWEKFYINFYRSCGFSMLNIRDGGSRGKHSAESIEKMRGRKATEKQINANKGNKYALGVKKTDEQKEAISNRLKGVPLHPNTIIASINYNKGRKHTKERIEKKRIFMIGKKHGLGHKWSADEKKMISERMKGKKNSLGYKLTENHKKIISEANKGKNISQELRELSRNRMIGNKLGLGGKSSSRKVKCLNNGVEYESVRAAAKELSINESHIPQVCRGKENHVGGYKFTYA